MQKKKLIEDVLASIYDDTYITQTLDRSHVWQPTGCDVCGHSGYKGRTGIFEAILMDEAVEQAITDNPSERGIADAARPQGILTMKQDGVLKVLAGTTSLDELRRVVELEN